MIQYFKYKSINYPDDYFIVRSVLDRRCKDKISKERRVVVWDNNQDFNRERTIWMGAHWENLYNIKSITEEEAFVEIL